jgi:hypothetical protein
MNAFKTITMTALAFMLCAASSASQANESYAGTWTGTFTKTGRATTVKVSNISARRADVVLTAGNGTEEFRALVLGNGLAFGRAKMIVTGPETAEMTFPHRNEEHIVKMKKAR